MRKVDMSAEEIKRREDTANTMCICPTCPTYIAFGKEDDYTAYCFPTHGKSKNLSEHGCKCPTCMYYEKMNFLTAYYCTRDTEMKQKAAIAEAAWTGKSAWSLIKKG